VNNIRKYALIVAGGSGVRMLTNQLKQFISVAGKPVLMHTIGCFTRFNASVDLILVLPESQHEYWKNLCSDYGFDAPHLLVPGGETRFHSVMNGLSAIPDDGIVFIHDGVRPLVNSGTLQRCLEGAILKGNAIPVVPVSESVREIHGANSFPVNRDQVVLIQTPQTFRISQIKAAYSAEYEPGFTDDASVLEKTGATIHLVAGNRENIKITWPEDLLVAEAFLKYIHL